MKKYLIGLGVFALSFFVDVTPVTQTLASLNQADDAYAAIRIFGRAPLMGGGCENGVGICIEE
ncbi:MAG: hypothetical protein QNK37_01295 [Acidobacteriota bacterium]|nr:hypothetical protein [Acidobacteriota bacterium]